MNIWLILKIKQWKILDFFFLVLWEFFEWIQNILLPISYRRYFLPNRWFVYQHCANVRLLNWTIQLVEIVRNMFQFGVVLIVHFGETVGIIEMLFLKVRKQFVNTFFFYTFKIVEIYLVTMSRCFDIPNCCCQCHNWPMFGHNFLIDFSLMHIAAIASMNRTISDYGDDLDFVAWEMMHFWRISERVGETEMR